MQKGCEMLTFAINGVILCQRCENGAERAQKSRERSGAVSGSRKNERSGGRSGRSQSGAERRAEITERGAAKQRAPRSNMLWQFGR